MLGVFCILAPRLGAVREAGFTVHLSYSYKKFSVLFVSGCSEQRCDSLSDDDLICHLQKDDQQKREKVDSRRNGTSTTASGRSGRGGGARGTAPSRGELLLHQPNRMIV